MALSLLTQLQVRLIILKVDLCVPAILTTAGKRAEGVAIAKQYFHTIPEHVINDLIKQGDVMWCAGGFTVEHMAPYLKYVSAFKIIIQNSIPTIWV